MKVNFHPTPPQHDDGRYSVKVYVNPAQMEWESSCVKVSYNPRPFSIATGDAV